MKNMLPYLKPQNGAVLITSLVLLVVLTLLGLSSIQNTTLEERMSGNYRSSVAAFQAAESGLRAGEATMDAFNLRPTPDSTGSNGVWVLDAPPGGVAWWKTATSNWWATTANINTYANNLEFVAGSSLQAPRYLVEEEGLVKDSLNVGQSQDESGRYFYQITSRGTGVNQNTVSLLRITYARRY